MTDQPPGPTPPEGARPRAAVSRAVVLRASAWAVGSRWTVRLLGLLSTIVLARLLTPADFGVVGTAMIVIAFSEAMFEMGVRTVLIHADDPTRADYDTAWTMSLIQAWAGAALTAALAVPAAAWFDDPRVVPVMYAMAAAMAVGGLRNIGIVDFQRDLAMGPDFVLFVVQKVSSVAVAIAAAFLLRSYWALVAGYATFMTSSVILSYVIHPYRPRLSLSRWRRFLRMSLWLTMQAMGRFAQLRLDRLIVGGAAGTGALGFYSVASDLANMLVGELLAPMARALLPAYAALQTQAARLRNAAEQAVAGCTAVALPAAAGAALTAPQLILVVFGEQWLPAVPVFQILCLVMGLNAMRQPVGTLLIATGRVALPAWGTWAQAAVFAGAWALWFRDDGLTGFAFAVLIAQGCFTVLTFGGALKDGLIGGSQLARAVGRPLLACVAMAAVLLELPVPPLPPVADLGLRVTVGGVTYGAALLGLWLALGRPRGVESLVVDMLQGALRRRRATP